MPKKQQITESFGLGGLAVILVAVANHHGKELSLELALAILASLSPVAIMIYGALRRYYQKLAEKNQSFHDDTLISTKDSQIEELADRIEFLQAQLEKVNINVT